MYNIPTPALLAVVIGISVLLLIRLLFWLHKKQVKKVEEDMQSWLKRSKDELLMSWGPPTSVFPMDNGKEIWSYNKIKQRTDSTHKSEYGTHMQQAQVTEQYIVKRDFFIDENGIIFHFRWENW
jgi:hypothetical protein